MVRRYIQIARTLTVTKVWNLVRLYSSFIYSRLRGTAAVWGMPASMSVEPGTACNLRCSQCPSGLRAFTRETGMMDPELLKAILPEVKNHLCSLTLYFQGEPYLNKHFTEMARLASAHNIYTITSTNGHYLDERACRETVQSGLGELIISVDGATQESYAKYREGGTLQKALDGTRRMLTAKKELRRNTPHIVWQFLVFSHNEKEIPQIRKMAREMGVDELRIKTAQVYDHAGGNALLPSSEAYARYHRLPDGTYAVKNPLYNHCWRMWRSCVITWKGEVVPCCFDKDASYKLGKVPERSFAEVWRSPAYHDFRKRVLTSRKTIDICTNCSEGTKVWA